MENPIKIDDLGVPLFMETPIYNHPMVHPVPQLFGFPHQRGAARSFSEAPSSRPENQCGCLPGWKQPGWYELTNFLALLLIWAN